MPNSSSAPTVIAINHFEENWIGNLNEADRITLRIQRMGPIAFATEGGHIVVEDLYEQKIAKLVEVEVARGTCAVAGLLESWLRWSPRGEIGNTGCTCGVGGLVRNA